MSPNGRSSNSKFLIVTILTIFSLLSVPLLVDACEKSCRVGISTAFSDAYTKELASFYTELTNGINTFVFDNVSLTGLTDAKTSIRTALQDEINFLYKDTTKKFPALIERAIFAQSPPFLGQCQHPYRVDQPPAGVRWKDEDCVKMDYICGNPPAICHFMDSIVKPRNVQNVKNMTRDASVPNGQYENALVSTVTTSSKSHGLTDADSLTLGESTRPNIRNQLQIFVRDVMANFCSNNNCEQYDANIKYQLLGYP